MPAWPLLVPWILLPVAGDVFAAALDGARSSVQIAVGVGLWALWAGVVGAILVPLPVTLTVVRIVVPAGLVATLWAAVAAGTDAELWVALVGIALAAAACVVSLSAAIGEVFIDGASYGPEKRMPLRPPGALLLGPVELGWAAVVVGATAGPLLLADQRWIPGALALALGWPIAAAVARSLHVLAQRCVAFVPNGFVIIDRMTLADSFLVQRRLLASVGPAPADTQAYDLTAGALGLAVQVQLSELDTIVVNPPRRSPRDRTPPTTPHVRSVIFAPSRPGAFLEEADRRRLPVG